MKKLKLMLEDDFDLDNPQDEKSSDFDLGEDENQQSGKIKEDELPIVMQLKYFYSSLNKTYLLARYLASKDSDFYEEVSALMTLKSYFADFLQNWDVFSDDKRKKIFKTFKLTLSNIIDRLKNKIQDL